MGWDRAKKRDKDYDWSNIKRNRCLSYATPFSNLNLIRNSIYVSHGRYVSQYQILNKMWSSHKKFSCNIKHQFRIRPKVELAKFKPGVLLENGDVFLNVETPKNDLEIESEQQFEDWADRKPDMKFDDDKFKEV